MHPLALLALIGVLAASPVAAEKVQQPTGKVAPKADKQDQQEAAKRREAAEWIKRCDKVGEDQRMQCLEDVRTQIVQQFNQNGEVPSAERRK